MNETINEVVTVTDGRIDQVVELVKTLSRLVKLNADSVQEMGLFTQSIAQYVLQLQELVANANTSLSGVVSEFSDKFDLLELMQDSQMEFIKAIEQLSYFNTGLGVFNTFLIFVLGIVILRKK